MPDINTADPGPAPERWQSLQLSPADDDPVKFNYTDTVLRRRSRRNFIPNAMSAAQFSCLMKMVCDAYLTVNQGSPAASKTVQTGFLCFNVDNIKSGYYLLNPATRDIGRMSSTNLIPGMTAACLNQEWLKNAAMHFLFMTDLEKLDHNLGVRGYRYAMMTAGRLGHIIYLAATSMGLGSCGIGAFYDNEAMKLLGMAETSALLYMVAVGPIR